MLLDTTHACVWNTQMDDQDVAPGQVAFASPDSVTLEAGTSAVAWA